MRFLFINLCSFEIINCFVHFSPKVPGQAERPRVPPVILKKMTPPRLATANNSSNATSVYGSQSKLANTTITRSPASINSLIDLTDEEDSRRALQNGSNPPALVAIPNNQGNKMVVGQGKVNFVTLKPQSQLQMIQQQNRIGSIQKVGGTYGEWNILQLRQTIKLISFLLFFFSFNCTEKWNNRTNCSIKEATASNNTNSRSTPSASSPITISQQSTNKSILETNSTPTNHSHQQYRFGYCHIVDYGRND